MREDEFGITGSDEVYVDSTIWDEDRRNRYGSALVALIYGNGNYVDSPYVPKGRYREGDRIRIEKGIKGAFEEIMKSEPVGQRNENKTATPKIKFDPNLSGEYNIDRALGKSGNDVTVTTEYIDDQTGRPIEKMTKSLQVHGYHAEPPKKFMKNLQEKYPQLFGLMQLVVTYEAEKRRAVSIPTQ